MAHLFNIYFTHGDVLHNAIISVRTGPFFTEYVLGNMAHEVLTSLPSNVVIATDTEIYFQNSKNNPPTALMNAIIKSINEHLHAGEALT